MGASYARSPTRPKRIVTGPSRPGRDGAEPTRNAARSFAGVGHEEVPHRVVGGDVRRAPAERADRLAGPAVATALDGAQDHGRPALAGVVRLAERAPLLKRGVRRR